MTRGTFRVAALAFVGIALSFSSPSYAKRLILKVKRQAGTHPLTVSYLKGLAVNQVAAEVRSLSGVNESVGLQKLGIVIVESDGTADDLKKLLNVDYVEEDTLWYPAGFESPNPADNTLGPCNADNGLNFPTNSLEIEATGDPEGRTLVAVVDTGTMVAHPVLSAAIAENAVELSGVSGVDDDANGVIDDTHGASFIAGVASGTLQVTAADHGTHVSGLVKVVRDQAIEEGYSQARNVEIVPLQFIGASGAGSTSDAIAALEYAALRGVKVVNASWGARGEEANSEALKEAMETLYLESDMVIAVAAGNAQQGVANDNDVTPYYPANYSSVPSLISVASVTGFYNDSSLDLSAFSNFGKKKVHVAAVGSCYTSAFDTNGGVYSANGAYTASNFYTRKMGTSMATPIVAGIAAVIRAINPTLTAYEVKKLLLDNATRNPLLTEYMKTEGVVNASAAFAAALKATTTNSRPAVGRDPYKGVGGVSTASTSSGGGCFQVQDVSEGDDTQGPLGGNSLGLAVLFFAFYRVFRLLAARNKSRPSV